MLADRYITRKEPIYDTYHRVIGYHEVVVLDTYHRPILKSMYSNENRAALKE